MLKRTPDFEATINFLTTGEGGRRTPVKSEYRPNHDFGHPGGLNDAIHYYDTEEWIYPGQTVRARLTLLNPSMNYGRMYVGMQFTVQEGARIVGRGSITNINNPLLELTHPDPSLAES